MSNTPNLSLPYIEEGQVRGEITYNEAMNIIDALLGGMVIDITATPPASPTNGDRFIIASGATGAWTGKVDNIACWYDGWVFIPPKKGMFIEVHDLSQDGFYYYNGTSWATAGAIADISQTVSNPPTQSEVNTIQSKVNALLAGLRALGILRS